MSQVLRMHLSRRILMHQHGLRCQLVGMLLLLLLLRRMRSIGRLMHLVHGRVMGITVYRLSELGRLLAIHTSSMLVMRWWRGHGCWRVGLGRVVNGWIRRALHVCGCCHRIWRICFHVSSESQPPGSRPTNGLRAISTGPVFGTRRW
jgi:hypothetical protein